MFSNSANLNAALTQAQRIAPLVIAVALGASLLLSVAAVWQFRLSRVDRYWRFRRAAGERGARLATIAALCVLLAGGACAANVVTGMFVAAWHSTLTPGPGMVIVVVPNAATTHLAQLILCTATPIVTITAESTPTVTPSPVVTVLKPSVTPPCQSRF